MTPKAGKRDELVAMMSSRPSDGVPHAAHASEQRAVG
jgi:hypothetical protein